MARVKDLWFKTVKDPDGKTRREKTARHGKGKRWLAVWTNPEGREQTQAFTKKVDAENHGSRMDADKTRGNYIDPNGAKKRLIALAEGTEGGEEGWLKSLVADPSTRQIYGGYWRVHIKPRFGHREIGSILPSEIRAWIKHLETKLSKTTIRNVLRLFEQILQSAVDDDLIAKNPCASKSIKRPKVEPRQVVPWTTERVLAVHAALPERYAIMALLGAGCGLRKGEILGLSEDAVDFDKAVVHVRQQVKLVRSRPLFALPKHDRIRAVPLPASIAEALKKYQIQFPAREVTLPWEELDGKPRTLRLIITGRNSNALRGCTISDKVWRPALVRAGVVTQEQVDERTPGRPNQAIRQHGMHALRHYFASMLLDAGVSVKALAEYLGHSDPGYTLRTYTHLMSGSENRAEKVINAAFHREILGTGTEPERSL
ncbi:tyrosine-type recombinase/integrase [Streptosporangium sp. NPDC020072]|uniref:tyrosine-type recombinase/integrase n=1 Tax=Streptosporangium sp. NPDC020072 TaxID=3154788 RepID=UPI0034383AD6